MNSMRSWNSIRTVTQAGTKIAGRNRNNFIYADDITLMAESDEKLKSLLMKVKEESEKLTQNSTFKKLRSWYPILSLTANRRGGSENSNRFYFLKLQNHCGQ